MKFYNLMPTSNLLILDFHPLSAFQLILIRFMFHPKVVIHVLIQLLLYALSEFGKPEEPLATITIKKKQKKKKKKKKLPCLDLHTKIFTLIPLFNH